MQGWCRGMVARFKTSDPGSDFSLPLGWILGVLQLVPPMLLSPGLVRPVASLHSPPDVQGLKSGRVPWCLQSCALEQLFHAQLQPVVQPRGSSGNWHDWGSGMMVVLQSSCMASLCFVPTATVSSIQQPFQKTSLWTAGRPQRSC